MKRILATMSVLLVVAPFGAHAATTAVNVVGYQFVSGGYVTADPLNTTGGTGTAALPSGTPLDGPTLHRGDHLAFANMDPVPHSVKWVSGPTSWTDVPLSSSGGSGSLNTATFATGTYVYRCGIHAGMRGSFTLVA